MFRSTVSVNTDLADNLIAYDKYMEATGVTRSLVIQSYTADNIPSWIEACLSSVRAWAQTVGYDYAFMGDEFLLKAPGWYRDKVGARLPIVADLARLVWIQELLQQDAADVVIWLDADTLVFAPDELKVNLETDCAFGREHWLQLDGKGRERIYRNVHNGFCAFRRGSVVLPFLIHAVSRLVERVEADAIAPQFVGPKLLGHLHSIVGFELDERFGAISPYSAQRLIQGEGLPEGVPDSLSAANLCLSLADEVDHATLVERLRG